MDMTPKVLKDLCRQHKLYSIPELNEILYLHYKGFGKIDNLEAYTALRCVYLEGNGLGKIEGLSECKDLRVLYLQENCISKIENLEGLPVSNLNLAQNFLRRLENLRGLPLTTLNVKHNKLKTAADCKELLECPTISVLDLSDNLIDDLEILDILAAMPSLKVLYLKGNDVTKKIKNYRKSIITKMKHLTYLDDRPVFDEERLCCEAWAKGGIEAERAERKRQVEEKRNRARKNHEAFQKMIDDARAAKRKEAEEKGIEVNIPYTDSDEGSDGEEEKVKEHSNDEKTKTNAKPKKSAWGKKIFIEEISTVDVEAQEKKAEINNDDDLPPLENAQNSLPNRTDMNNAFMNVIPATTKAQSSQGLDTKREDFVEIEEQEEDMVAEVIVEATPSSMRQDPNDLFIQELDEFDELD